MFAVPCFQERGCLTLALSKGALKHTKRRAGPGDILPLKAIGQGYGRRSHENPATEFHELGPKAGRPLMGRQNAPESIVRSGVGTCLAFAAYRRAYPLARGRCRLREKTKPLYNTAALASLDKSPLSGSQPDSCTSRSVYLVWEVLTICNWFSTA